MPIKGAFALLLYVFAVSYTLYYVCIQLQGHEKTETIESGIYSCPDCLHDSISSSVSLSANESKSGDSYDTPFLKDLGKYSVNRMILFLLVYIVEYDYNGTVYPIPFSELYNDYTTHYKDFGKPNPLFPSFVLTGPIPSFHQKSSDVLMITGASDNHAIFSFSLLYSMILADPYGSILYIDLDITLKNRQILAAHFNTIREIQQKMKSTGFLAYRVYNWDSFPVWMNLFKSGGKRRGAYSWKVIPVYDAFKEWKGLVTWLDAGCLITDGLSREFTLARRYGFYSPQSAGNLRQWCHKKSQQFLLEHHFVDRINQRGAVGMGGVVFLSYHHPTSRAFMQRYIDCAYTQKCIGPIGSSVLNHRQDQAVMSVLAHHFGLPIKPNIHSSIHNDNKAQPTFPKQSLENYMLAIQHTYHIKFSNKYFNTAALQYHKLRYHELPRVVDN